MRVLCDVATLLLICANIYCLCHISFINHYVIFMYILVLSVKVSKYRKAVVTVLISFSDTILCGEFSKYLKKWIFLKYFKI